MVYSRTYGGAIWTNHALERLHERKIPQTAAWKTFRFPDTARKGKSTESHEYIKTIDHHVITIIAKKNHHDEWIILSCWADPPFPEAATQSRQSALTPFLWLGKKIAHWLFH